MRRAPLVLAGLLLGSSTFLVLGPSATAQLQQSVMLDLQVSDYGSLGDGRLTPEQEVATLPILITARFPAPTACSGTFKVVLSSQQIPPYATAFLNPPAVMFQLGPFDGIWVGPREMRQSTTLTVTTNREAPAFQDGSYEIRAAGSMQSSIPGCDVHSDVAVKLTIKNDYVPLLQVDPLPSRSSGPNGTLRAVVTNLANGPSMVQVQVLDYDSSRVAWVHRPAEIRLQSRTGNPAAQDKQTVEIPYALSEPGLSRISLRFLMSYDGTGDGLRTMEQIVTFTVGSPDGGGPFAEGTLPFPGLGTLVSILAGAALLRRRA